MPKVETQTKHFAWTHDMLQNGRRKNCKENGHLETVSRNLARLEESGCKAKALECKKR